MYILYIYIYIYIHKQVEIVGHLTFQDKTLSTQDHFVLFLCNLFFISSSNLF